MAAGRSGAVPTRDLGDQSAVITREMSTRCGLAEARGPRPRLRRRVSADQQHELAAHVAGLADAVRLRDLGEREGLRDREREAPGLDQLADRRARGPRGQRPRY